MKPELMKWQFTSTVNHETGDIWMTTSMPNLEGTMEIVHREVARTKEAAFREALIALGWTPPDSPLMSLATRMAEACESSYDAQEHPADGTSEPERGPLLFGDGL